MEKQQLASNISDTQKVLILFASNYAKFNVGLSSLIEQASSRSIIAQNFCYKLLAAFSFKYINRMVQLHEYVTFKEQSDWISRIKWQNEISNFYEAPTHRASLIGNSVLLKIWTR